MKLELKSGDVFGNLTYLEEAPRKVLPSGQKPRMARCRCKCGTVKDLLVLHLTRSRIHNCGCEKPETGEYVIGKTYGEITVIKELPQRFINGRGFRWIVGRCSCGTEREWKLNDVKTRKSCGCKTLDILKTKGVTHGMAGTRLFRIWQNMKNRCYNQNIKSYKAYGAKGITVCKEWLDCFEVFRDWAYANGYHESLTLDRFPNRSGNYEPANCRWATVKQQANNKDNNNFVEYNGETLTISELCEKYNLVYARVHARIMELGWIVEDAVNEDKVEHDESVRRMMAKSPVNKKGSKKPKKRNPCEDRGTETKTNCL